MSDRVKTVNQYYDDLRYMIDKKNILEKIRALTKNINVPNINDKRRFMIAATVITENIFLFKACEDVDTITSIIEYLYDINGRMMFDNRSYTFNEISIIYAMDIICEESEVPLFLKAILLNNSNPTVDKQYDKITFDYINEMILLEDSDLYAVISYLKIKPSSLSKITTIFVQETIKEKFLWLIKKHLDFARCMNLSVSVFQTSQELNSAYKLEVLHMVSIWSEDIIVAKNLALSLNRDIVFINSNMEFCSGSYFLFKYQQCYDIFTEYYNVCPEDYMYTDKNKKKVLEIYNLFYDGKWQIPLKATYWTMWNEIKRGNIMYANATKSDITKCALSAKNGFTTWSTWSMASRIETLYKLASILECQNKYSIAEIILQCIKLPKVSENALVCYQDERLEVSNMSKSRGIIWLQEYISHESRLFYNLITALIKGNSVIVLSNEESCTIASYCNMFTIAGIPPGVINWLSSKDTFTIDIYRKILLQLSLISSSMKYIIHPLK